MAKTVDREGFELEPVGTCMTNNKQDSQHTHNLKPHCLWSYAQEAAFLALCEQESDKCWVVISDAERRVKRIAALYADLYFKSAEKSNKKVQFYWAALAAFVVKDIAGALEYTRKNVLQGGVTNLQRNSFIADVGSKIKTKALPYDHAMRAYMGLVKGNLWLFMDIYPWLWFFLEYGINRDGSLNVERLKTHVAVRDSVKLQGQSKQALKDLAFGRDWLARQQAKQKADPVYQEAKAISNASPTWNDRHSDYQMHRAIQTAKAHLHIQRNIAQSNHGYHLPGASPTNHWIRFPEAFEVLEAERNELTRIAQDAKALKRLETAAKFKMTPEIKDAYSLLISEKDAKDSKEFSNIQLKELKTIATHEQQNILQSVTYEDPKLVDTMNSNHWATRSLGEVISRKYQVCYTAEFKTDDEKLKTVFDPPTGVWDRIKGGLGAKIKSLPDKDDRMEFVGNIAKDFHGLMQKDRSYMNGELQKIRKWLNA